MQVILVAGGITDGSNEVKFLDGVNKKNPRALGKLFQDLELRLKDPRVAVVIIDSLATHLSSADKTNDSTCMQSVMQASWQRVL